MLFHQEKELLDSVCLVMVDIDQDSRYFFVLENVTILSSPTPFGGLLSFTSQSLLLSVHCSSFLSAMDFLEKLMVGLQQVPFGNIFVYTRLFHLCTWTVPCV